MEKQEEWLTLAEVAAEVKVEPRVIYNQRYLGKGPRGVRVGRELRFRRSEVERWLSEREEHSH